MRTHLYTILTFLALILVASVLMRYPSLILAIMIVIGTIIFYSVIYSFWDDHE